MRRKTVAILLSVCIFQIIIAINVSAEVMADNERSSVTISGIINTEDKETNIGIDVFCPGQNYETLKSIPVNEFKRAVVYRGQTVSNDKGEWSVTFHIKDDENLDYDAPSGRYTAVIYPQNAKEAYTEEFSYLNLNAARKAVSRIMVGEDISDVIKDVPEDLGLTDYYGDVLSADKLAVLIRDAFNKGKPENENIADIIGIIQNAAVIEAISEGRINNLFEYAKELKLSQSRLNAYLEKSYIIDNHLEITDALKNEYFNTYEDFYSKLEEATVIKVAKNPDGINNLREITEAIINSKRYSDDAYRRVMGKDYKNLSAYTAALDKLENSDSSGGSSGGSSGSGSGSKNSASNLTFPENKQQAAESMTYHIFTDIKDVEWAKEAIVYLAQKGIVSGKSEELFYPNDNITREELVKILVLAFAEDVEESEIYFKDADKSKWFYPYIAKAVKAGIVSGYSNEVFGVGDFVTRQDMAVMIYRAASFRGIYLDTASSGFADETQIADYAKDAVGALSKKGIVNGIDNYTFAPFQSATRAQIAKIVYRLLLV